MGEGSIVSLKLKAEEGNAKAQYQLGTAYATGGKGVRKDYKTAIAWLEKAAQQNHVGAQLELGNLYESAGYALRDYEKSYHWVEKAAVIGNLPEAYYALAFKYSIGQGVRQDMSKAIEFYERAGALGHVEAMEKLGNCYFRGEGVVKDLKKAHYWFEKGAETGESSHLQYLTALGYKEGLAGRASPEKFLFWLEKSVQKGDRNAIYYLGRLYLFGDTVKQDSNRAISLLKEAIEKGHVDAAELLGKLFFDNNMLEDANKYLSTAYAMGNKGVVGLLNDPCMIGIKETQQKAMKLAHINVARYISRNDKALIEELSLYFDNSVMFNKRFEAELDFDIESAVDALVHSLEKHEHLVILDHKCEPDLGLRSLDRLARGKLSTRTSEFKVLHTACQSSDFGISNFIGNQEETAFFDLINSCGFALIGIDNCSDAFNLILVRKKRLDGLIQVAESAEVSLQYVDFNDFTGRGGLFSRIFGHSHK